MFVKSSSTFAALLVLVLSWTDLSSTWQASAAATILKAVHIEADSDTRVLIELFVMSRCPDARRAEARFNDVLSVVSRIADVRTQYIADESPPGNITCKHGPLECAGDIQQLCAAEYGGRPARGISRPQTSLGWRFLMCQNARFQDVGNKDQAEYCLKVTGFPGPRADRVRSCWSGPEGRQLLSASAAEARRRGAAKSCTIYIGGEYRCTHDGGEWYDCPGGSDVSDFVNSVCSSYRHSTGSWPEDVCGPQPQTAR